MNVKVAGRRRPFRTVTMDASRNVVQLIEQRLLPHEFQQVETRSYRETARAIADMVVRGAGAIGATAAFGLAQGSLAYRGRDLTGYRRHVRDVYRTLAGARPTAVDPVNAMRGVLDHARTGRTVGECRDLMVEAAQQFADDSVADCAAIGEAGVDLLKDGMTVLTHCNAGWLAFVDIGSATAPIYAAHAAGRRIHVLCDETRPRCQGASLTAWELAQQGVAHHVIADNAAGHLMQRGRVDLVIVGADRVVARTGEIANKIGTYTKAVLARRHGIPFYVAIPISTIDWEMESGMDIPIEERSEDEVLSIWGMAAPARQSRRTGPGRIQVRIANPGSRALNPGFDVTPAALVTGILTPAGVFRPRDLWRARRRLSR